MERVSAVQLTLSSERSRHDCAVAKSSNADRISALCFTAFQAIACCCLFACVRHGKSKPRPILAHRRSIAAWLCCGNGHSSTQNCKSALGFTSSLEALSALAATFSMAAFVEDDGLHMERTETNCCSRDRCGIGYRRWRQIFHYLCWHGVKHSWSRRNVVHDSWTERSGRIDGAPINRNEERLAQEHGQTNCEACHRRIIEIGVHCRLQHGEDKQESHHELTHQSVPIAPSFSDSVGTKSLRAILQSNPVTQG